MKLHYFQHVWFENLGVIKDWVEKQDFQITKTAFFDNEPLPEIDDFEWLIVMGGPMNIYEEDKYPWLKEEKKFIKKAIDEGKIVLGICLGAQLIADVLGSKVIRNGHKEIGWLPITIIDERTDSVFNSIPKKTAVFHWHGDTFDCPEKALNIAKSEACLNQAFSYDDDRVIGLQFHFELKEAGIKRLTEQCKNELVEGKYIQNAETILKKNIYIEESNNNMYTLLNNVCSKMNLNIKY